jgi:hypothetical protein
MWLVQSSRTHTTLVSGTIDMTTKTCHPSSYFSYFVAFHSTDCKHISHHNCNPRFNVPSYPDPSISVASYDSFCIWRCTDCSISMCRQTIECINRTPSNIFQRQCHRLLTSTSCSSTIRDEPSSHEAHRTHPHSKAHCPNK